MAGAPLGRGVLRLMGSHPGAQSIGVRLPAAARSLLRRRGAVLTVRVQGRLDSRGQRHAAHRAPARRAAPLTPHDDEGRPQAPFATTSDDGDRC